MNVPESLPNYTGPYISDGKFQSSVMFGSTKPKDELDALSRLHDTAYAYYEDRAHREAADRIYSDAAKKLRGKFPELAADIVNYGNYTGRQAGQLASDVLTYTPIAGVVKFAGTNLLNMYRMINGTYLKKEIADVKSLYSRDPGYDIPVRHTSSARMNVTGDIDQGFQTQDFVPIVHNFQQGTTYDGSPPVSNDIGTYGNVPLVESRRNGGARRRRKRRRWWS